MSARPEAGLKKLVGPKAGSLSNNAMISMDSPITTLSKPFSISKIGAIFLPTSAVGVFLSSFAMKATSCLMFFKPSARRTRTQKGQWSYTYTLGKLSGTTRGGCEILSVMEIAAE
eukprot:scaffold2355_cov382-Prasinococcus_capsulatus_cf.AAC.12